MKSIATLFREANISLKGNWGMAILLMLISFILEVLFSELGFIAIFFVSYPITFGLNRAFLHLSRNKKSLQLEDLFSAFNSKDYWRCIISDILTDIFVFLWTLLFIIPGIIKNLSYSLTPYILADEPNISIQGATNKSIKMMNGHKARLFCIRLIFFILGAISALFMFIPVLWLMPLEEAVMAKFYEDVKSVQKPVEVVAEA